MTRIKYLGMNRLASYVSALPDKTRRLLLALSILIIVSGFAIGYAISNNSDQQDIYFPVMNRPAITSLQSLVSGKLVVDGGYLRVKPTWPFKDTWVIWPLKGSLIIWPYGYSWKVVNNEIWIINNKGQEVVRVGDNVRLGGGEIPASYAEEKIGQPLPDGISGPFWSAGGIVNN